MTPLQYAVGLPTWGKTRFPPRGRLGWLRVRGVTCPKIYELTPPHGTPLTPRPQELTPCANHHGTPALTDRFLDWFVIFLRDLVHFTSVREFFDLTPNVKERMAHLQIVFYQPKFSDAIPIVGTTYLISKNVIHVGFTHWHTEYIQVLRSQFSFLQPITLPIHVCAHCFHEVPMRTATLCTVYLS